MRKNSFGASIFNSLINGSRTRFGKVAGCGCIAIFVVVIAVCGVVSLIPGAIGGLLTTDYEPQTVPRDGDFTFEETVDTDLGNLVLARDVDRDGCPIGIAQDLNTADSFYIVAPNSEIPEGTTMFARLYQDNVTIEDLDAIEADQDYMNTCVNFYFETVDGRSFEDGEYEVEFFVNGNPEDSLAFDIGTPSDSPINFNVGS